MTLASSPSMPSPADARRGEPRRQRRALDHVQLVPGDVLGAQLEHGGDVAAEQRRGLAGDAVDQVEAETARRRRRAAPQRRRAGSACARRPSTARSAGREALHAQRDAHAGVAPPRPRTTASTSSGLASTVTSACGVRSGRSGSSRRSSRSGPSRLGVPPPRYERLEAAHVVRRPLALPLGAHAVDVAVEERLAVGLVPARPPPRRSRSSRSAARQKGTWM